MLYKRLPFTKLLLYKKSISELKIISNKKNIITIIKAQITSFKKGVQKDCDGELLTMRNSQSSYSAVKN